MSQDLRTGLGRFFWYSEVRLLGYVGLESFLRSGRKQTMKAFK